MKASVPLAGSRVKWLESVVLIREKLRSSPSASLAAMVVTAVLFSGVLNALEFRLNCGWLSLRLLTLMVRL